MGFIGKVNPFLLSLFSHRVKCRRTMQLNSAQLKESSLHHEYTWGTNFIRPC